MTFQAIFFDVDGTLTTNSPSWVLLHMEMGTEVEMEEYTRAYFSGEVDYLKWSEMDAELWIGEPVDRLKSAFGDIKKDLRNGVIESFEILKKNNIPTFLISGGISYYVNKIKEITGAHYAVSNELEIKNGLLTGGITVNVSDSKVPVIKKIAQENEFDLNKCAALGDAFNDIEMFNAVGTSLAISSSNNCERLVEVATYVSEGDDLREALIMIFPSDSLIAKELKKSLNETTI